MNKKDQFSFTLMFIGSLFSVYVGVLIFVFNNILNVYGYIALGKRNILLLFLGDFIFTTFLLLNYQYVFKFRNKDN